jgi:hypothetical protein
MMVITKMAAQETTTSLTVLEECSVKTSYTTDDSLGGIRTLEKKASLVSFNSAPDEIHEVPSASSLSKKEKLERWRSDDEFVACINACKRELHQLNMEPFDIRQFRGLELVDPGTCIARQKRYMLEVAAVRKEQQSEKQQGICDGKGIQKVYLQVSSQRVSEALDNACVDNMAVKEYMADAMLELKAEYEKKAKKAKRGSGGFGFNSLLRTLKKLGPHKVHAPSA